MVDYDPCYMGFAGDEKERAANSAVGVNGTIPEGELSFIRQSLQRGQLTGSAGFVDEIEEKLHGASNLADRRGQVKQRNKSVLFPPSLSAARRKPLMVFEAFVRQIFLGLVLAGYYIIISS